MAIIHNITSDKEIEAVLFDFDNTLLPTDQLRQQLSEKVLVEMNVENVVPGCCSFLIGITEQEGNDIIRDRFKIDPLRFRERRNFLENEAVGSGIVKPYPYVREAIQYINLRSIPWGIVTQSNHQRILDYLFQRKMFGNVTIDVIVGSDEIKRSVKKSKPHPDPYLIAAEQLKMAPANCLTVEDSDNGVRAALAANMQTMWFNNNYHPLSTDLQAQVNFIVDSFRDILVLLKNRFG